MTAADALIDDAVPILSQQRETMLDDSFLAQARAKFDIVGPPITEHEIAASFPEVFPGRDDLVEFYLKNNGGSRTEIGGLVYRGAQAHRASLDKVANIRLEGFFSIPRVPADRALGVRSMLKYHASRLKTFSEISGVKAFLERNKPIAFDRNANDIWIDLQSGCMRFMDWDSYRDGPIVVAPSFREFVLRFWIDESTSDLE